MCRSSQQASPELNSTLFNYYLYLRVSLKQAALRPYRPRYLHLWQKKTFWAYTHLSLGDIESMTHEDMDTLPPEPLEGTSDELVCDCVCEVGLCLCLSLACLTFTSVHTHASLNSVFSFVERKIMYTHRLSFVSAFNLNKPEFTTCISQDGAVLIGCFPFPSFLFPLLISFAFIFYITALA